MLPSLPCREHAAQSRRAQPKCIVGCLAEAAETNNDGGRVVAANAAADDISVMDQDPPQGARHPSPAVKEAQDTAPWKTVGTEDDAKALECTVAALLAGSACNVEVAADAALRPGRAEPVPERAVPEIENDEVGDEVAERKASETEATVAEAISVDQPPCGKHAAEEDFDAVLADFAWPVWSPERRSLP